MSYESLFVSDEGADHVWIRDSEQGALRRIRSDEIQAVFMARGVAVLQGVLRFLDVDSAHRYSGLLIESVSRVYEACLARQLGREHFTWEAKPLDGEGGSTLAVFVFECAMGNGAPFPQPSGTFDISLNGDHLVSFTLTKRSRRWVERDCTLYYDVQRVQTASFGTSFTLDEHIREETSFVDGFMFLCLPVERHDLRRPLELRIDATNRLPSMNWVRVGRTPEPGWADVITPGLERALRAPDRPKQFGQTVLFGDLHNHSGESFLIGGQPQGVGASAPCGVGSRESLFRHARDIAGLDFFCLSEHDWQLSGDDWKHLNELTERYCTSDGSFLTLHGYEWTSPSYGHRNVYFRSEPGPWSYSADPNLLQNTVLDGQPTPADLWSGLRASGATFMTVPHHMSAKQFPLSLCHFYDERYDLVAEIYSCWGDSLEHGEPVSMLTSRVRELAFIHSIRAGYHVGFIASSDSHDGHPGTSQGTEARNHMFHYLGSGEVGVLVGCPSREEVFDALSARRCFASTGENIVACTEMEGHLMGSVVKGRTMSRAPTLRVCAGSFLPFQEVAIYRNGWMVDRILTGPVVNVDIEWRDPMYSPGDSVSYFAKVVRCDGERAWTSPIWVVG